MKNYIYYLLLLALSISCTANKKGIAKQKNRQINWYILMLVEKT